jgi:hypothetical protein
MNEDSKLRKLFASLRRADAVRTPTFERVLSRTRPPEHGVRGLAAAAPLGLAATLGLAAVIAAIVRLPHRHASPAIRAAAPMLADWRAPTDFLLDTPGRALLDTVPELGVVPAPRLDPSSPPSTHKPAAHAAREHS